MTSHKVVRIGGRPVDELLDSMQPALIAEILQRLIDELPVYSAFPEALVEAEVRRVCSHGIDVLRRCLRNGNVDTRALLRARRGAARRAEDLVPLGQVLAGYSIGVEVCQQRLAERAGPEDVAALAVVQTLMFRFLRAISESLADGYADEVEPLGDDELIRRYAALDALLAGVDVDAMAMQTGISLPPSYFVLAVAFDPPAPAGKGGSVLARRTARLVRQEFFRRVGGTVLTRVSETGGIALVPAQARTDDDDDRVWKPVADLLDAVSAGARTVLTVAGVSAVPARVADGARLASELLELALTLGRGPGLHRLEHLALEYQLSRPSAGRARLAAALAPRSDEPQLLATLRTYIAQDLSRRRTADLLGVHPNTVDNRLRRVASLTGLDVCRNTDLSRISAALVAMT